MPPEIFFELQAWVGSAAMASARVAPLFFMLPFLNEGVFTGVTRTSIIVIVGASLWPHEAAALPGFQIAHLGALAAREAAVGLLLGCLIAWPFWVFHALGSIIDNQRGATLSSTIDPINGVDTSELANLLSFFSAAIYLQGGGLTLLLEVVQASYNLCDPLGACLPPLQPVVALINKTVSKAVVLASPVMAALLLSEAMLGLLSRFAPQMNAFAVSLTVKSAVALFILLIYFSPTMPEAVLQFAFQLDVLGYWPASPDR